MTQLTIKQLTIMVLLFFLASSASAELVGQTDDAMSIGGGARPIGMGRAFVAVADDADACFINPAGLASIKGPEAMTMYTNLLNVIYYREYSGAIPAPYGTLGIGFITTGVNEIPTTVNNAIVNTDYHDNMFVLSYASSIGRFFGYGRNLYGGLNFKFFDRGFTGGVNERASGYSADFGLKLVVNPQINFGLTVQNFLPVSLGGVINYSGGAEESLAGLAKFGVALKPINFDRKLLVVADIDLPLRSTRPPTGHVGLEWRPLEFLAFRSGLDQSVNPQSGQQATWDPAYGMSFGYANFRFDYAYHPFYNDPSLANTYFSLTFTGEPWLAFKGRFN